MENKDFTSKLIEINNNALDTINGKVLNILGDKADTHYIELDKSVGIDDSGFGDVRINYIELDETGDVLYRDNNAETYAIDDYRISIWVRAEIADALNDEKYSVEEF